MLRRDLSAVDPRETTRRVYACQTLAGTRLRGMGGMAVVGKADGAEQGVELGTHRRRVPYAGGVRTAIGQYSSTNASGKKSSYVWIVIGTRRQRREGWWATICIIPSFSIGIRRVPRSWRFRRRLLRRSRRGRLNTYVYPSFIPMYITHSRNIECGQ